MMFVVNMAICHVFYGIVDWWLFFLASQKWQVSFEGIREFVGKSYDLSNFLAKYQAKPIRGGANGCQMEEEVQKT